MNKDLRTFLAQARQLGSKFFAHVSRPVDPVFEPCVIQQKLAAEGRFPVLSFDRINGSDIPLVTNLFGSYELLGLALDVKPDQPKSAILQRFRERAANPIPVREVSAKDAPVKQVVLKGDDIDLGRFPILHHAERNADKYITIGCLIVRDPESGVLNAGVYRHQLKGKKEIAGMFNPAHHGGYIYRRYKAQKKPMEAVLFLGHHPAAVMGALARGQMESNELEIMGALMNEPLEVVRAETVDLPVPAWAEIALEGVFHPDEETWDGPFSEYTGFYGPRKEPVGLMKITAVTTRKDAIYHDLDPSHREHNLAGVLTFESSVYDSVKKLVPSVTGVYMPVSGACVFTAYVSLKKNVPGEGISAGLAAIAAEPNLKMAIVVDHDIDIYDEEKVLWAVATHCEADRGIVTIPNAMGAHLNPSAYGEMRHEKGPMNTKLIIDATAPATLHFEQRIHPPKEAWDRIRLEEYLDPN